MIKSTYNLRPFSHSIPSIQPTFGPNRKSTKKKRYPHPPQSIWIHCLVYLADWKLCQQLKPYHTECARENGISLSQSLLIIQRVTVFKTLDSTWGLTFYTAASRARRWGILFHHMKLFSCGAWNCESEPSELFQIFIILRILSLRWVELAWTSLCHVPWGEGGEVINCPSL